MTDHPTDTPIGEPTDPTTNPTEPTEPDTYGPPPGAASVPPPPAPAPRRLVRDPYSRLGGVASGVAHYYGFDVSIVRILFLLFAFATGFGFFAYLLAWLIIPRADHWPPGGGSPRPFRSLTGRDLGLGLAGAGLLVALAFGGGVTGSILVPLILVGGGVWLLLQPAANGTRADDRPAAPGYGPPPGGYESTPAGYDSPAAGYESPPAGYAAAAQGSPVPPRSRGRRAFVAVIVTAFVVLILLPVLLIGGLIFGFASGNIDLEAETVTFTPSSIDELPIELTRDAADVTVDLTGLDPSEFEGIEDPLEIDLNIDFGQITVIVPSDIPVSVDAEASAGEIDLFEQSVSGIGNQATTSVGDPVVDITIDMGVGDVNVVRP